jgi:hypothetical protein
VSDPSYTVELTATAAHEWNRLAENEREEVLAGLQKLARNPLPGGRSGVIRLRGRAAEGQPLCYSHTTRFGLYHIVIERRVCVLLILERPQLEVP